MQVQTIYNLSKEAKNIKEEEISRILFEFNNTEDYYQREKNISMIFEEQVQKTPDNIAVVYEDKSITYDELNKRANRLSNALRQRGVMPGAIVGIMMERSMEIVIAIIAIIKSGGAYMPIDPRFPKERIRYLLEDSKIEILISQEHLVDRGIFEGDIIYIDDKSLFEFPDENPKNISKPSDLAYVIYTSGSTGKPKGVMIEHRNVINFIEGINKILFEKYVGTLNIAASYPFVFDASVMHVFGCLLHGHTMYIVPENVLKFGRSLEQYYVRNSIDIAFITPTLINLLLKTRVSNSFDRNLKIKCFGVGGEALYYSIVKEFLNSFIENIPDIINMYGPTECCVCSTSYHIEYSRLDKIDIIPIGKPLINQKIYILGEELELLPVGSIGEIYIAGEGVGRGYLNREQLTLDRFVESPFGPGERMYKTGDLGRWMEDGNIEFMGRSDFQVKIRGYRVELGEIESKILGFGLRSREEHASIGEQDCNTVKEVIVLDKFDEKGYEYLCAYIVSDEELDLSALKDYLLKELPDYMLPSSFIRLEKMPLTINGKVDRGALLKI
jgi:fengycin family lipopeptide synthetase D